MATQADRGVPLSTLCPKYLHTNSTSHTWPFSAIAELIDNAYDPDVSANQFWIDKTMVQGQECLIFMDNGNGLDHKTMHKMLSFGYSDKTAVKGHQPIGMYGNGFKSGSMRLGKDTIVFSKSKNSMCVGMLSQTYLEMIGANQIIIPIVCFEKGETNEHILHSEHKTSLQDILHYSPFKTQEELLTEIDAITSTFSTEKTGTRIIIWNLRSTSTRTTEFDFETDRYDIRIPSDVYETLNDPLQQTGVTSHIPACRYSLRVYCSILYLKPRMQINIRGQKVKSELIAKSLARVKKDYYTPTFLQKKKIPITFGYNTKSKEQYGVMMYHKNRLIKAYERLGCQLKANNKGVGVIGIIECDYLEPTHNKQSFTETDKYRKTMSNLAIKLEEYWQQIRFEEKKDNPNSAPVEDGMKRPDQNWVQCDNSKCLKWRKLPDGIDCNKLPDKWFCRMNPDPQFRNCQVDEEPVDSDDDTRSSYQKTYKQHEREAKNQEKKRQQEEEEQRRRSDQHKSDLNRRKAAAKLTQNPTFSPSTPTTPRTRFNTESSERGAAVAESFTISQTACSPSSSNGLPVITDVCSLSTERGKRTNPNTTPQRTPKRLKMDLVSQASSTPSTPVGPQDSPSVSNNNNDTDETDDDVHILESESTPKPKKSEFSLAKVKTEREENTVSKESPLYFALDANVFEMGNGSDPPSTETTSNTTQTEMLKVKIETESQNLTDEDGMAGCSREGQTSDENIGNCIEEQVIKQESSDQTEQEDEIQDNKDEARPPGADVHSRRDSPLSLPSMMEVQEQQDQLLELMQTTAQERDALKEQVHIVTSHLQETQSKLQELSQINEKKVCYPRATQTEAEKDYKSLFEKLRQKINEVMEDKEALPSDAEMESSSAQDEEKDIDQTVLKVERLCQRLDQRNQETDELHLQLNNLETERADLALQCENLNLSLQQQQSENAQERSTTPEISGGSSVERESEVAGNTATEASRRLDNFEKSLIELRHNVGRLLVSFVPALELDQVNYECSVIDEILEQFLSEGGSV
ncbi:uncharacterized protein V6R79_006353 [Siganus canaliculatus]